MAESAIRRQIMEKLWKGHLDLSSFPSRRFRRDLQGWNSQHSYLTEGIESIRPSVVIEIGVWKGGSSIHMADQMRRLEIDAVVIAVDTWLGSWEHWEQEEFFPDLLFDHGYPSLYFTFLANVVEEGVEKYIVPLPLDSANAAFVVQRKHIFADMIHIDGGHDYDAVLSDMHRWWKILRPGGLMVMDDYDATGAVWPSVRDAVDYFRAITPHLEFEASPYKARLIKPPA